MWKVNNINIRTPFHTVVTLWWNDLCLEWIFELVKQELLTLPKHMSSPPMLSGVCITRSLVLCVMFCRSLFVFLYFFFLPIVLSVLRLRIPITPLVSSNSSYTWVSPQIQYFYFKITTDISNRFNINES